MTTVIARPDESIDSLLRRFKKAIEHAGIISDLKRTEYYEKPSIKKKHKQAAARKRDAKKRKLAERYQKPGNINFKFNKDKTQKIPLQKNKTPYRKPYNRKP